MWQVLLQALIPCKTFLDTQEVVVEDSTTQVEELAPYVSLLSLLALNAQVLLFAAHAIHLLTWIVVKIA